MSPLVSVLMPVYNAEKYLSESIDSILVQTYKNFELIIIDDGSTDRSASIVENFVLKDSRIKFVKNEKNLKLIKTLNIGLSLAKGDFIARMDADDIATPDRIELQINEIIQDDNISLVASSALEIDSSSKEHGVIGQFFSNKIINELFVFGNQLNHSTVLIRKSKLKDLRYDLNFPHAEDFHLWVELSRRGSIVVLKKPLVKYRIHSDSVSSLYQNEQVNSAVKSLKYLLQLKDYDFFSEFFLMWILTQGRNAAVVRDWGSEFNKFAILINRLGIEREFTYWLFSVCFKSKNNKTKLFSEFLRRLFNINNAFYFFENFKIYLVRKLIKHFVYVINLFMKILK